MSTPETPAPNGTNGSRRRKFLRTFGIAVTCVAVVAILYYFIFVRGYVETDNAYVNGNLVQVTAQTGGTVVAVGADETETVAAGSPIVSLDPIDAKMALDRAESGLAGAVREVRGTFASTEGLSASVRAREAEVARARADVAKAQQDVDRRVAVRSDGGVSAEELEHARTALTAAQAALKAAEAATTEASQNLEANQARIEGSKVATHPTVLQAAAAMKEAYIAYRRTTVVAPVNGVIARKTAQLGARVQPGQTLATIVPLNELWVDANFKEGQLHNLRIGQPVTLESDLYGGDVEYHGKVVGLGAGTGGAFSLLPAQNASGNWIKVVQRVPVRIALDPKELADHPLRIGLSMSARVDTRDTSGTVVDSAAPAEARYRTNAFEGVEKEAQTRVEEVIAANLFGRSRPLPDHFATQSLLRESPGHPSMDARSPHATSPPLRRGGDGRADDLSPPPRSGGGSGRGQN